MLKLEVQQCTTTGNAMLIRWYSMKNFAVPQEERGKYYASKGGNWSDWELPYELYMPALPGFSYRSEAVFKGTVQGFWRLLLLNRNLWFQHFSVLHEKRSLALQGRLRRSGFACYGTVREVYHRCQSKHVRRTTAWSYSIY